MASSAEGSKLIGVDQVERRTTNELLSSIFVSTLLARRAEVNSRSIGRFDWQRQDRDRKIYSSYHSVLPSETNGSISSISDDLEDGSQGCYVFHKDSPGSSTMLC